MVWCVVNSPFPIPSKPDFIRDRESTAWFGLFDFLPIRTKNPKYVNRWSWERREEVGRNFLADYGWGSWKILGNVHIGKKVHVLRYATLHYAALCKWAVGG